MIRRFWASFSVVLAAHALLIGVTWRMSEIEVHRVQVGTTVIKVRPGARPMSFTQPKPKPSASPSSAPTKKFAPVDEEVASSSASEVSSEQAASLRDQYKAELRAKIEENKFYPATAKRLGQSGTVIVAFTLLEDGHIIDLRLDTPSRFESLNVAALEAVRKVHVFRPIPRELNEARMDVKVPLKFFRI